MEYANRKARRGPGRSLVLGLGLALSVAGGARGELEWSWKPGQTLHYRFVQTTRFRTDAGGAAEERAVTLTADLTWEVGSVEDGTAEVVQSLRHVRVEEEKAGAKSVTYDSKAPADAGADGALMADLYGPAIAEPATLRIDRRGRIVGASVPRAVTEAIRRAPPQAQIQVLADAGGFLSEPGLKNLLGQVLPSLPERPVGEGAGWEGRLELTTGPFQLMLANRYTLGPTEGGVARIDSTIATDLRPRPGASLKVELRSQSGRGDFRFDTEAGRLASTHVSQKLEIGLESAGRSLGQTIDIEFSMGPGAEAP